MPLPFVVGTDIVQVTRPTYQNLVRLQRLARRILHPSELDSLRQTRPRISQELELVPPGATETRDKHVKEALLNDTRDKAGGLVSSIGSGEKLIAKAASPKIELSRSHSRLDVSKRDVEHSPSIELRNFVAGRWAAKEAARKAWGAHSISFKDVRVERVQDDWQPPGALNVICQPEEITENGTDGAVLRQEGALSISHDGDYVVATVIAEPLKAELRKAFKLAADKAAVLVRNENLVGM